MQFHGPDAATPSRPGLVPREFTFHRGERKVTGVLWQSEKPQAGAPLVLCGHGASGSRHQAPIPHLAEHLVNDHNMFVLAIDGPVHGRRQVGPGGREAFWPEWKREGTEADMVADWQATLDAVQALPEVGAGPVGYYGLSMGTIYGAPLVAAEPRIKAAVLGLMGISGPDHYRPKVEAAARAITCPVFFLWQLEDELFPREECLALFDALASNDKRLHANPGLHPAVPMEEIRLAREFLHRYLLGTPEPRDSALRVSE